MHNTECIFCKIGSHDAPATVVFENDGYIAFRDINPEAPTHVLVLPKKHVELFSQLLEPTHVEMLHGLLSAIRDTVRILDIADNFKLLANNGKAAGQIIPHVHFHLISQKNTK